MRLIIISPPKDAPGEAQIVDRILQLTSATFHLRKPEQRTARLSDYLNRIPAAHHPRIMVHGHKKLLGRFNLKGLHYTEKARHHQLQTIRQFRQEHPGCRTSSAFHQIADVPDANGLFDYIFLSPIFDSISKPGYHAAFDHADLIRIVSRTGHTVIALGGINQQRIAIAARLGFNGVAVLGAVWRDPDPEKAAVQLWSLCREP